MRKVFILFYSSDRQKSEEDPCSEKMTGVMEKLFLEGKARGIDFYRVHMDWFDPIEKKFTKCWAFESGKWSIISGVQPDIVFDRCSYSLESRNIKVEIASSFHFVNNPIFDEIASNKYLTYLLLSEWMPKTVLLNSHEDLDEKINGFDNCEKFVVKPLDGYGGRGVVFFDKNEVGKIKIAEPSVLQEFIDSSSGIENIVKGNHDLRLLIFGKEIFGAYARVPRDGCLCSNVAQGGKRIVLKKEDIPFRALSVAQQVIKIFGDFGDSFYSIDFVFDREQTPLIMELNSRLGLVLEEGEDQGFFDAYLVRIIGYLKSLNFR